MTKLIAVLALAVTVSGRTLEPAQVATPTRPDFSGSWTLVDDGSTPPGSRGLGKAIKISQSPTTVTIEATALSYSFVAAPGGGLPTKPEPTEMKFSTAYICDGAEHETPNPARALLNDANPPPPGAQVSLPPPMTYRATWTTGQLVIVTQAKTSQGSNIGAMISVSRTAISLDADGSLIVDTLTVPMLPRANGPKQAPPVPARSVYKKT